MSLDIVDRLKAVGEGIREASCLKIIDRLKSAWLRGRFIFVEDFLSKQPRVLPKQKRICSALAIA